MSVFKNYLSNIDKKSMKDFVEKNFYSSVGTMNADFDPDYGKIFYCHTYGDLKDITGIEGYSTMLGNFGVLRKVENFKGGVIIDDFMMAKLNLRIFENYVLFVALNNLLNGKPIKIDGLTYSEAFNKAFDSYIKKLKKKKFIDSTTPSCEDIEVLKNAKLIVYKKLQEIEKAEPEMGEE